MSTQTVVVVNQKSMAVGLLLTFFFGPLGMLYSTVLGAVIMFFVNILAFVFTAGIGLLLTWPIGLIWSGVAISSHNSNLVSTGAATPHQKNQEAQAPSAPVTERPAATDQPPVEKTTPAKAYQTVPKASGCAKCGTEMEADDKFCFNCGTERKQQQFCANCGNTITANNKFCSGCGAKVA